MYTSKKTLTFFCVLLFLATAAGPSWGFSRKPPEPAAAAGIVLVKFREGVSPGRIAFIVEQEDSTVKRVLESTGVHIITLPRGLEVSEAVGRFSAYEEVEYAEPSLKAAPLEVK